MDTVTRYFRIQATDQTIIYRLIVASTTANLSNANCSFITSQPKTVIGVNCNIALPTTLLSFRGQVNGNGLGVLSWSSAGEVPGIGYSVERSDDGTHFTSLGSVPGTAGNGEGASYQYTDSRPVKAQTFYRINMIAAGFSRYSNLVMLSDGTLSFQVRSALNPFSDHISVELTAPNDGAAVLTLLDLYGRVVRRDRLTVTQGINTLNVYGVAGLPAATYALLIQCGDRVTCEKLVKVNAH